MRRTAIAFLCLGLASCSTVGRIKTKLATVIGVPDAGKSARIDSVASDATLPIPEGSKLVVTKIDAVPAKPATETAPEVEAQPAREVTEIVLSKPTEWRKSETRIAADTGTTDQTLAKHRIDVAESRYLLWASLGAVAAAGVFLWLKYPTPAMICGAASVIFFLAWKLSGMPTYFWVIGAMGIAGAGALWLGHERGEKSAKGEVPK